MRPSLALKTLFLVAVAVATGLPSAGAGDEAAPLDGMAWLARSFEKLQGHRTAEWAVELEVIDLPADVARMPESPIVVGTSTWQFRVKGASRVHFRESREGSTVLEAWYEGLEYYVASGEPGGALRKAPVGEGEAICLRRCLVDGGLLGWRLTHGLDEGGGSAYVAAIAATVSEEGELEGRKVIVIDSDLGFGFGPERARRKSGTSRLWIDRETLLPIRRETALAFGKSDEGGVIRVREAYSGFRLDEPIPDAAFHVEGMPEPDPLVEAPDDPSDFERFQTRKFLGFAVKDLPGPRGPSGFSDRVEGGERPRCELVPREWSGPKRDLFDMEPIPVVAEGPGGARLEAICCRSSEQLASEHPFRPTRADRRHRYGMSGYSPQDVYIGKRVEGKIVPRLFFRDVGSHDTDPFDISLDAEGRCHLVVADVDIYQGNRLKLLWLVGDPATGKWLDAHLVDERKEFTSWAHCRVAARGDTVHLLWNWKRDPRCEGPDGSGVYHVSRGPDGFGEKVRILAGATQDLAVGVDPESGRLVALVSTESEILAMTLSRAGVWSDPVSIHRSPAGYGRGTLIRPLGGGRFLVRSEREERFEWILTCE